MWAVCVADGTRWGTYCVGRGLDQTVAGLVFWVLGSRHAVTRTYRVHQMAHSLCFSARDATSWKDEEERSQGGRTACLAGLTVHHRCCRPSVATRRVRTYLKFNMWQRWLSIFLSTRIVRFGPCVWLLQNWVCLIPLTCYLVQTLQTGLGHTNVVFEPQTASSLSSVLLYLCGATPYF